MICYFCKDIIHVYEEFYTLCGLYFHHQIVTQSGIRCERIHNRKLLAGEKKTRKK